MDGSIDKKTYKAPSSGYHKKRTKKRKIILCGSERKENYHIKRLMGKANSKNKNWCTYTISRDGTIYEHYNPDYYSDYMDDEEVNKESIFIVLENAGALYYYSSEDGEEQGYKEVIYNTPFEGEVYDKKWRNFRYWEQYSREQFNATVDLCEYLCNKFEIEPIFIGDNVYFNFSKKFGGILVRGNFDVKYVDLNPSFDFKKFNHLLEWGDESDEL